MSVSLARTSTVTTTPAERVSAYCAARRHRSTDPTAWLARTYTDDGAEVDLTLGDIEALLAAVTDPMPADLPDRVLAAVTADCTVSWCSGGCRWVEDFDGSASRHHVRRWPTGVLLQWTEQAGDVEQERPAVYLDVRSDGIENPVEAAQLVTDVAQAGRLLTEHR